MALRGTPRASEDHALVKLSRIPPATEGEAAAHVAAVLLRHAEGPTCHPATWEAVAGRLGVFWETYHQPGASRGEFVVDPPDGESAAVAINTAYPDRQIARAAVHELAHVLLYRMQPPLLPGYGDAGR